MTFVVGGRIQLVALQASFLAYPTDLHRHEIQPSPREQPPPPEISHVHREKYPPQPYLPQETSFAMIDHLFYCIMRLYPGLRKNF